MNPTKILKLLGIYQMMFASVGILTLILSLMLIKFNDKMVLLMMILFFIHLLSLISGYLLQKLTFSGLIAFIFMNLLYITKFTVFDVLVSLRTGAFIRLIKCESILTTSIGIDTTSRIVYEPFGKSCMYINLVPVAVIVLAIISYNTMKKNALNSVVPI